MWVGDHIYLVGGVLANKKTLNATDSMMPMPVQRMEAEAWVSTEIVMSTIRDSPIVIPLDRAGVSISTICGEQPKQILSNRMMDR